MSTNNEKSNLERWFLLGLIAFGLLSGLAIELLQIAHRPIVLLIFIGISVTALIYNMLGGLKDSFFGHGAFRVGGSGAFLIGFLFILNPILERQSKPGKNDFVVPHFKEWIAVNKNNLRPVNLYFPFSGITIDSTDFARIKTDDKLMFNIDAEYLYVLKGNPDGAQVGKIPLNQLENRISSIMQLEVKRSMVFQGTLSLNAKTPVTSWFPYHIVPIRFEDNVTSYAIHGESSQELLLRSEILLRGTQVHNINGVWYAVTVHSVNHESEPFWSRFAIAEIEIHSEVRIN
jgi:hypothetical protein